MLKCKEQQNKPEKYSLYYHGYFLPWLEEKRDEGLFHQGRAVISSAAVHSKRHFNYVGELDSLGRACGFGIATDCIKPNR